MGQSRGLKINGTLFLWEDEHFELGNLTKKPKFFEGLITTVLVKDFDLEGDGR